MPGGQRTLRRSEIVITLLIAGAYAMYAIARLGTTSPKIYSDSGDYAVVRDAILAHDWHSVRVGYRPPAFPLVWALCDLWGVPIVSFCVVLNAIGGCLVSLAGFTLGRAVGIGVLVASTLILISPAALSFSTTYLSEAIAPGVIFFSIASCMLLTRQLVRLEHERLLSWSRCAAFVFYVASTALMYTLKPFLALMPLGCVLLPLVCLAAEVGFTKSRWSMVAVVTGLTSIAVSVLACLVIYSADYSRHSERGTRVVSVRAANYSNFLYAKTSADFAHELAQDALAPESGQARQFTAIEREIKNRVEVCTAEAISSSQCFPNEQGERLFSALYLHNADGLFRLGHIALASLRDNIASNSSINLEYGERNVGLHYPARLGTAIAWMIPPIGALLLWRAVTVAYTLARRSLPVGVLATRTFLIFLGVGSGVLSLFLASVGPWSEPARLQLPGVIFVYLAVASVLAGFRG